MKRIHGANQEKGKTLTIAVSFGQGDTVLCVRDMNCQIPQADTPDDKFYSAEANKEDCRAELLERICK